MVSFNTYILKFKEQGEKTGWTYIVIDEATAHQLNPNTKKSFRVKGRLDDVAIEAVALLPMGDGSFIMALNATIRKALKKSKGEAIAVLLALDEEGYQLNADFLACLHDEPVAMAYFNSLTQGHRNYFSKWIDSAKTIPTQSKRIAMAVNALAKKMGYPEMIRNNKKEAL